MKRVNAALRRAAHHALSMFASRGGMPMRVIEGPLERPRDIVVGERVCERTGRIITRVTDRRWHKPHEHANWFHNSSARAAKRFSRMLESWR